MTNEVLKGRAGLKRGRMPGRGQSRGDPSGVRVGDDGCLYRQETPSGSGLVTTVACLSTGDPSGVRVGDDGCVSIDRRPLRGPGWSRRLRVYRQETPPGSGLVTTVACLSTGDPSGARVDRAVVCLSRGGPSGARVDRAVASLSRGGPSGARVDRAVVCLSTGDHPGVRVGDDGCVSIDRRPLRGPGGSRCRVSIERRPVRVRVGCGCGRDCRCSGVTIFR